MFLSFVQSGQGKNRCERINFSPFPFCAHIFLLILQSDSQHFVHNSSGRRVLSRKRYGSPRRAAWDITHKAGYGLEREARHIRRLSRIVLDVSKSCKPLIKVLNLATIDAPVVIYTFCIFAACISMLCGIYTEVYLISVWALRCLFNFEGQCRSLDTWNRQQRFHVLNRNKIYTSLIISNTALGTL